MLVRTTIKSNAMGIDFRLTQPNSPFLLASDIDGTLLGDPEGEAWIKLLVSSLNESIYFAVITGRSLNSIANLVQEGRLPQPDFMVGSVGTELVDFADAQNILGKKYTAQVSNAWNLDQIYAIGEGPGIQRQDFPEGQPPHQAGFSWDGKEETLSAFYQRLTDLDRYDIQASSGIYIDVLPKELGKGNAALFLQKELHLEPEMVVVAGDTGNDQQMFTTGLKGIVPVNALDELKSIASKPWHYHSPYPAGRGLIDGLRHFGFIANSPLGNL